MVRVRKKFEVKTEVLVPSQVMMMLSRYVLLHPAVSCMRCAAMCVVLY